MREGFISKINMLLPKLEIGSIVLVLAGFLLLYFGNPSGKTVLMIGMSMLAGVFYLNAFTPLPAATGQEDPAEIKSEKPKGFLNFFITIVWKVIHISSAIGVIGLLFYFLKLPGYGVQLLIAAVTLGVSLFISIVMIAMNNKNLEILKTALLKSTFLLLLSLYILYNNWPLPQYPPS